jgi:tRNA A-37 threonylcarbamoyl transferase component Bud32/membrane-associated phospholipid phosphatase
LDVTDETFSGTPEEHRRRPGHSGRRHRRPSGEAPPLPHELGRSGKFWIVMVVYFGSVLIGVVFFQPLGGIFDRFDTLRLRWIASLRSDSLTDVVLFVNLLASRWTIRALRWGTIAALVGFRHWRHLFVFLGSMLAAELVAYQISVLLGRSRPLGITIIAPWEGYSMPSRPVVGLAASLVGITYALVVPGRPREIAKWVVGGLILALVFARLYLAVDHPTDVGFGAIMGIAIPLVAFRWYTPNDVFPVTYRRGKAAHLDVGGRRGEAIRRAAADQLGYEVLDIKPVGLAGSGGSTPLRLRVGATEDQPEQYLFAKLYAKSHVRADRWYKLGRSILYGALEDETPFQSVRRFVEYEDYTLRLLYDEGLPTPKPYGVVEITPEREYMIVMEFFDGAVEIGDAEIDDAGIDEGLQIVRKMWDVGLAHRDVKPANLMVRDGKVLVIDVFFVQVRPSPWRQAVDLANMMLVLGVKSDAKRVYEHALAFFTEDEIAEAFAAARGVASPTQLRSMLKQDGRDLVGEFRALAPERDPVSIQRWSVRRILRTAGVLVLGLVALLVVLQNWNVFA